MKKADMEIHHGLYHAMLNDARECLLNHNFRKALNYLKASWEHIDGMMRFEKKYGDDSALTIASIDLTLRYAPLLFDFECLNELAALLQTTRRIDRETDKNLSAGVQEARAIMWHAHALWTFLEEHGEATIKECQRYTSCPLGRLRMMIRDWSDMGVINSHGVGEGARIALATRMGEVVDGKCTSCGCVDSAPKAIYLEHTLCPGCRATAEFVILSDCASHGDEDDSWDMQS